ncbi:hypothetical protein C8J56DRAFT_1171621 [Mycena floridula]|nr:hypothetical protein C8J56DRAFT_1171621 [Mycena floridula]
MSFPVSRIRRCNDELDQQKLYISALENQRKILERHIEATKALTAPIRRIPVEILSRIFGFHCVGGNLVMPAKITLPVLTIALVCFHWKNVAMSDQALFSDIGLEFDNFSEDPRYPPDTLTRAVELLLKRSGSHLLSINIITGFFPRHGLAKAWALITSQSMRWGKLALMVPNTLDILPDYFAPLQEVYLLLPVGSLSPLAGCSETRWARIDAGYLKCRDIAAGEARILIPKLNSLELLFVDDAQEGAAAVLTWLSLPALTSLSITNHHGWVDIDAFLCILDNLTTFLYESPCYESHLWARLLGETIIPSFSAHWISRQLCTIQAKLARKPGSWMRNQCISKESVRSPLDDSMTKEIHQGEKMPVRDDEKHFMKTRHPSFSRGDSLHCSATALQPPAIPTNLKFDIMQRFSCQSMQKGSTSRLSLLVSPR